MATLAGWHQPHGDDMDVLGTCDKYLVNRGSVWENIHIRNDMKLTKGMCKQREWQEHASCRSNDTGLVNGICSHSFNIPQEQGTHVELSDDSVLSETALNND